MIHSSSFQDAPSASSEGSGGVTPFNLRLTTRPLRCLTGLTIPPGLVGFCWETPLCLEVLHQQAPALACVAAQWPGTLRPIVESRLGSEVGSDYGALEGLSLEGLGPVIGGESGSDEHG